MKRRNQKHAFTVVELVIIIAVVAILAAVIIPTYVHLVKKANESNAQLEAKNIISEMLTDILLGDKASADLLIFSEKGNDVYLNGYCAEQQRFITYGSNPIAQRGKDQTLAEVAQNAIVRLQTEGAIEDNPDVNNATNPNDWRLDKNSSAISGNLSEKYEVVIYASYRINADKFAAKTAESEHHLDAGTVTKKPTCTEKGEKTFKCTDDGCDFEKKVSIPALGHNFVDGKCTREGCGATKLQDHVHNYNLEKAEDAFKIKPATCTERGVYYLSCECGEHGTKTFAVPALGHDWDNGEETTAATCVKEGVKTHKCKRTGCTATDPRPIPATGVHEYVRKFDESGHWKQCTMCNVQIEKAAHNTTGATWKDYDTERHQAKCNDCDYIVLGAHETEGNYRPSSDGNHHVQYCKVCNVTRGDAIYHVDKLQYKAVDDINHKKSCPDCKYEATENHGWNGGEITTVETCTAAGVKTFTCAKCERKKTEAISAMGHDFGEYQVTTPAKCTEDGVETQTCSRCQATQTRPIPKLGHDWSAAWMHNETHHWHVCTREGCKDVKENYSHNFKLDQENSIKPTCTKDGKSFYKCECGAEKNITEHATGHAFGEWKITKAATCTEKGLWTCTCTRTGCGASKQIDIDALGHNWNENEWEKDDKYHWHKCSRCGTAAEKEEHAVRDSVYGTYIYLDCKKIDDEYHRKYCKACGYEAIEKHSTNAATRKMTDPTCMREGRYEALKCPLCDHVFEALRRIAPLGHKKVYEYDTLPCTKPGETVAVPWHCGRDNCDGIKATGTEKMQVPHKCNGKETCTYCGKSWRECVIEDLQRQNSLGVKEVTLLGDLTIEEKNAYGRLSEFKMYPGSDSDTIKINLNGHKLIVYNNYIDSNGGIEITGSGTIEFRGSGDSLFVLPSGKTPNVDPRIRLVNKDDKPLIEVSQTCPDRSEKTGEYYFVPGKDGHRYSNGKCRNCGKTKE